jgi:hypothetical protein
VAGCAGRAWQWTVAERLEFRRVKRSGGSSGVSNVSTLTLLRRKLTQRNRWHRIFLERLAEPLHLNLLSLPVIAFGSYRMKVAWDLVIRQQYAYGILKAADLALEQGLQRVTIIEAGVAAGAGLMNMAHIAAKVSRVTGVSIEIHGFDTGAGMPAPVDYRDHPDIYGEGDFPMDVEALQRSLPRGVQLELGALAESVPRFLDTLSPEAPIGFVAFDVDYYSSTKDALELLKGEADRYLPLTVTYFDDITLERHNSEAGMLLAIREFNETVPLRQLERYDFFEQRRIFRRSGWVKQVLYLHVLDHPDRSRSRQERYYIENPYIGHTKPEGMRRA